MWKFSELWRAALGIPSETMPHKELVEAIRRVHAGQKSIPPFIANSLAEHLSDEDLTQREIEILRCVADGNRNREIANRLFIPNRRSKSYYHVLEKLGAVHRTHAVAIAVRRGIIHM